MMRRAGQFEHGLGNGHRRRAGGGAWMVLAVLLAGVARAQNVTPMPVTTAAPPALPALPAGATPSVAQSQSPATMMVLPKLPGMPAVEGEQVDRVVAIVNGDLILDSDVDRERRFAALLPYGETAGPYSRDAAIERLINRELILQQLQLQPGTNVTQEAASRDLDELRKSIPTCKEYHCETKAGWDKFLATEGFTEESLTTMWRQRMDVLAFIELRFRMGIKVEPAEIREYYEKTLLPQYAALQVTPPPVHEISGRIQEVLLQQRVSKLLDDWLDSLRAQGNVVVLHSGEEAP
ncbi:MAG: peptidylprolyl isomerase [Acidobacteriaceae bacterium]